METILRTAIAASALLSSAAIADMPVVDAAALLRWGQQAKAMADQLTQMQATVHSLTNVPQQLVQQVAGLLTSAVQNPLGDITKNLDYLLTGRGVGTCGNAQDVLAQNQYASATGGDFTGQWLNQSATRNAGVQGCTQQMLVATQARLQQMPQLLSELQGAQDVTQVASISARIQYETATITAQQQQANTMAQMASMQHMMAEDQQLQKMRADAQERINNTSSSGSGTAVTPLAAPAPFVGQ